MQNPEQSMNIYFFIAYGHLSLLFLLAFTALPDVIENKGIELISYYFKNHRYFWGIITSVVILSTIITFFKKIENLGQVEIISVFLPIFVFIVLLIILVLSRKYWDHSIILVLFFVETVLEIIRKAKS